MKLTAICLCLLACVGCSMFETTAKTAAALATDALKAQLPGISDAVLEEARALVDKGIEEATALAAEKAKRAADAGLLFIIRQAGEDPAAHDLDGSGRLEDAEMTTALAAVKNSSNKPWWLDLLLASGALGAVFTGGKTFNRYLREHHRAEIHAEIGDKKVS